MFRLRLILCALAVALTARGSAAQELPGAPSAEGPPALTTPYGRDDPGRSLPPPRRPSRPVRQALFTIAPDLELTTGYSDNVFITPDVVGFRPEEDGIVGIRPRLRILVPLSRTVGVVGDYHPNFQGYLSNGDASLHAGRLFLGYRPAHHRHGEIGVRGGRARVSEFAPADTDEVHGFLDGTWGPNPGVTFGGSLSIGVREFPNRRRSETEDLIGGLLPIPLPIDPGTGATTTRRGQEDVVYGLVGRMSHAVGATGLFQIGYDFGWNDSDVSSLDYWSHRVTAAAAVGWTAWLRNELSYSARFRGFTNETETDAGQVARRDTIHAVSVDFVLRPGFLRSIPFTRSALLRLGYDALVNRSNVETAEFERSFLSAGVEIGFPPLTSTAIRNSVFRGFAPPPPHRTTSG